MSLFGKDVDIRVTTMDSGHWRPPLNVDLVSKVNPTDLNDTPNDTYQRDLPRQKGQAGNCYLGIITR